MFIPKISIIIPVYNSEKYLHQCLDSVINQSLRELEIICVNDGSTDNSPSILDDYAARDNRIKVIHQSNQHTGPAKNNGMEIATGNYFHFLDSDDFLVGNAYEAVYQEAVRLNVDNLRFKAHAVDITGKCPVNDEIYNLSTISLELFGKVISFMDYPEVFTKNNHISYPGWNGLYKNSFMKQKHILFDAIHSFEDILFYYTVLINAERIAFFDHFVLNYRKNNPDSLVGNYLFHFEDVLESHSILEERTRKIELSMRHIILRAHFQMMIDWYDRSRTTGQNWKNVRKMMYSFVDELNIDNFGDDFTKDILYPQYLELKLCTVKPGSRQERIIKNQLITFNHPYYESIFPFRIISHNVKIAIYGAGAFGKRTVSAMEKMGYEKPCIWIDRNYDKISIDGYEISNPDEIINNNFNFIIIAIENKEIIKDVREFLLNKGVSGNKIIWRDTNLNLWINE
jgi:glycosyltransferase involved in cell wall biosynthesis